MPPPGRWLQVAVGVVGIALILVTLINGFNGRYVLNPDGVSYLDLTERLLAGDGTAFVQGYWSPLYPAFLALIASVAGHSPATLLFAAHALNALTIVAAILLLWWWGRRAGGPYFTLAALSALFLVSAGFPRIEAVTPDTLLLALTIWVGYELLVERGARWLRTGSLLGLLYLVKTSAWPWLFLSVPLRLWGARDAAARRDVLRSVPVMLALMLLWVIPMSVEAGHPTLGSAGRLNYCWYIDACDSRSPDSHRGQHAAYHEAALDPGRSIIWAEFDADRWTYAPWSDPTAWDAGVVTRNSRVPSGWELVSYWGRQAGRTFSRWLFPVLAGILLPWSLFEWRSERRRWWLAEGRPVLAVALIGAAAIGQFLLIHVEPRLLAPCGMLLALALLYRETDLPMHLLVRKVAVLLGLTQVAWSGYGKVSEGFEATRRLDRTVAMLAATKAAMAHDGISQARIVVLGPAIPVEGPAYLSGARIVAQVLPASADLLDRLSPEDRNAVLARHFGSRAQVAWRTTADGNASVVIIPRE